MTIGRNRDQEYKAMTCLQIQTGVHIYMISKRVEYSPAKLQCLHLQYLACSVGSDELGVVVPGWHRLLQSRVSPWAFTLLYWYFLGCTILNIFGIFLNIFEIVGKSLVIIHGCLEFPANYGLFLWNSLFICAFVIFGIRLNIIILIKTLFARDVMFFFNEPGVYSTQ